MPGPRVPGTQRHCHCTGLIVSCRRVHLTYHIWLYSGSPLLGLGIGFGFGLVWFWPALVFGVFRFFALALWLSAMAAILALLFMAMSSGRRAGQACATPRQPPFSASFFPSDLACI